MRSRLGVAATVLAALLVVTGCSTLEGVIEGATGGDVQIGGDSIPADFPSDVPVIAGEVLNGSAATGGDGERVWNVLLSVADPDPAGTIVGQLEGAGFVATGAGTEPTAEGGTLIYAKDTTLVTVLLAKVGDGWTVNYTVARTPG